MKNKSMNQILAQALLPADDSWNAGGLANSSASTTDGAAAGTEAASNSARKQW